MSGQEQEGRDREEAAERERPAAAPMGRASAPAGGVPAKRCLAGCPGAGFGV